MHATYEKEMRPEPPTGLFVGLATLDIVYGVSAVPRANSKNVATRQALYAGGPATNAAATFSALGGRASLAAIVGRHPLSAAIQEDLERCRVALVDLSPDFASEPSFSSIFVDEGTGERIVVSANATRLPAAAKTQELESIRAGIVLVDGHLMECATTVARSARAGGIPVVLDGGSWKDGTERLLAFVDIAICSQDFRPPGTASADHVIDYLQSCGVRRCAITRGARPVYFRDSNLTGEIPVPQTVTVDTLGAGDVFHGAFCHRYLADGGDFRAALQSAAAVASFSCRFFGTRDWMKEWAPIPPAQSH